jgi:Putative beta-barrel porin-2, OmpL-like. bbp2
MPLFRALFLLAFLDTILLSPVYGQDEKTALQGQKASIASHQLIANSQTPVNAISSATRAPEQSSNQVMLSIHGLKPAPNDVILREQTPKLAFLDAADVTTAHRTDANANPVPTSNIAPRSKPQPVVQVSGKATSGNTEIALAPSDTVVDLSAPPKLAEAPTALDPAAALRPAVNLTPAAMPSATAPAGTPPTATAQPAKKVPFWETATPFAPEGELRRGLPAPLDPVFPSTEYIGVAGQTQIGIPDTNSVYPLEKAIYKACPLLKRARIEIYGWTNPGMDTSTSRFSNIPQSYSVVPRKPELDQQVFRIERNADTVQQEHNDWGFRISMIYGIDTRYTVADGWYPASGQILGQNKLYSWDPVELYGTYYVPKIGKHKIFDGLMIKYGRYISPADIEAQLAPDNYLWTHSLMFTYDNYTQTGILASIKLNKNWMVQAGIHSGDDIAPWSRAAIPSGEACLRWQSNSNKDSIYLCADSFNDGHYRLADKDNGQNGHDNLNQYNVTWGHRFSRRIHMMTEAYWLYEINALQGGTVESGSPHNYFRNVGPGQMLPGMSQAWGLVNYTNFKITDKDYITLRPVDILGDPRGVRTGFRATYGSWTIGWCHRFNNLLCIRPEVRYERALHTGGNEATATPYNNGTRLSQISIGFDVIQRF